MIVSDQSRWNCVQCERGGTFEGVEMYPARTLRGFVKPARRSLGPVRVVSAFTFDTSTDGGI